MPGHESIGAAATDVFVMEHGEAMVLTGVRRAVNEMISVHEGYPLPLHILVFRQLCRINEELENKNLDADTKGALELARDEFLNELWRSEKLDEQDINWFREVAESFIADKSGELEGYAEPRIGAPEWAETHAVSVPGYEVQPEIPRSLSYANNIIGILSEYQGQEAIDRLTVYQQSIRRMLERDDVNSSDQFALTMAANLCSALVEQEQAALQLATERGYLPVTDGAASLKTVTGPDTVYPDESFAEADVESGVAEITVEERRLLEGAMAQMRSWLRPLGDAASNAVADWRQLAEWWASTLIGPYPPRPSVLSRASQAPVMVDGKTYDPLTPAERMGLCWKKGRLCSLRSPLGRKELLDLIRYAFRLQDAELIRHANLRMDVERTLYQRELAYNTESLRSTPGIRRAARKAAEQMLVEAQAKEIIAREPSVYAWSTDHNSERSGFRIAEQP